MNHKMRFVWLFVSLAAALALISLGTAALHTKSLAVAQASTTRDGATLSIEQETGLTAPTAITVGLVTDGPTVEDGSFNELSYQGILRAESELGITYHVYTSSSEADYLPNLEQCASNGADLCFGVGFLMADAISQTAVLYPGTSFALVDYEWESQPPNLRAMTFASDQVGYLAGTLAALMSDSQVVGTVAGMEIPSVTAFVNAYHNAAQCADPSTTVIISYTGTFVDPDLGAQTAQEQMLLGADVIFGVGGATGNGAILTATQSGAWGIGVDSDQYNTLFEGGAVPGSDRLLSSAMKRLDNAVFDTIGDVISGTFTSGTALYTVAEDGVGLAPFHETDPFIPQSVRSRLSGVEQGLCEGWLDVYGPCVATIGVAADLSGPVAELGWQEANAVQLAISQTNAAGGLNLGGLNYTLRLAFADDACDATQAITAAQTLLDTGALAVVGHTCSPASMAAQALYAAAGVPMISPSSTNPDVTQQGYNTTFRVITHDGSPVTTLATYLRHWSSYERSAFVATEGYYQWALNFYSSTFTALGGTITGYHLVTDTADFYDVLADIKHNEQPDVIFYANSNANEAGLFSRTADEVGMNDVPIAWSSWDNAAWLLDAFADTAGLAAEGDFVMMQHRPFGAMPGWETFQADYQAAGFSNFPDDPGLMGTYAYDAAGLLLDAFDRAQAPAPDGVRSMLAATTGYYGVMGMYDSFDGNGDVIPQWGWIERYRAGQWSPVYAIPEFGAEIRVCDFGCDYATIQDAVDAAADGDIIKVAAGTYSDLHTHVVPPNYHGDVVTLTQVVYVDKSITLRGGYTTTDWVMPDLVNNATVLDAQGGGRVFVVAGFITPTIEGFHITGGDASGLLGSDRAQDSTDAGGGVFVIHAPGTTLNNCQIYANTAQQGGGIYLDRVPALIYGNNIYSNTGNYGGGATLWDSNATLIDNTISGNTVTQAGAPGPPEVFVSAGGGLEVDGNSTIIGNIITGNSTDRQGGGLAVGGHSQAVIKQNTISANSAITGGGLYMAEDEATLEDNLIRENVADIGGGAYLYASNAWVQSNQVLSNTANFHSAGVHMYCVSELGNTAAALFGNKVLYNVAGDSGGGIGTEFCPEGTIKWNTITDNEAPWGAGLNIFISDIIIDSNFIADNVAADAGGGILFHGPGDPKVLNNVIVRNHANQYGGAVMMIGAYPQIVHTTFSENTSGDGSAVYIQDWEFADPPYSDAYFENVILADSAVGIKVTQGSTVTIAGILWYNVPLTVTQSQTASVTIAQQITGDPAFVDPANNDYHIGPMSAAIDQGIDGGLDYDFEEQVRPMGQGYDLGADEYLGAHLSLNVAAPAVVLLPGQTFTYDVVLANDGALTATNTLLTFTLDPQQHAVSVTPGGVCTVNGDWGGGIVCPLGDMPPGTEMAFVVTAQVAATVPLGQAMESTTTAMADGTASSTSVIKIVSRARLVYPLNYEPRSLDVNREAGDLNSLTLLAQLMEAPYRYGSNGSLIPAGATGYTASPDGLVYTVTLRTDALWSDGVPVTAQHYADSVIRMLDPTTGAGYAFVLYPIQGAWEFNSGATTDPATVGVAALDTHTLRFTLHSPAAFFPSILATSAMYPVRLDAMDTLPFVGNGPYVLTEWASGRYFVLDKNPLYHSAAQVVTSRIVLPFIPDAEQVAAYEAGLLDVSGIPGAAMGYVLNDPTLSNELRSVPWPGIYYLGLNNVLTPTDQLAVRQALASAVDRDTLLALLNTPWREAATSVIPPGIPGYQNGAVGYAYNSTQAQAYLAAAGYPGGAGFPGVELWATEGARQLAEAVAANWRSVLNISVTVAYPDDYFGALRACRDNPADCTNNAYRLGWLVDYADASNILNDLFHPDAGGQYTGWDNARYRELMTLQISELDPAQRLAYIQEADRILVQDEAAVIPLYFFDRVFLIKPNIAYEYPTIGGPRLMAWRTSGAAAPCYVRVSSLPGITYNDLQTAVDAAQSGDTLKVAGTCIAVHSRPRHDLTMTGVVTQVAYIDKALTLQGGYTTTNWLNPNPTANPTTLDALEQGRVAYVTGDVNVTLDGFRITGGDASGQGGSPWVGEDAGGGVYIITATVT
ncbi:MAG: BMP family ABC transporter substrate-binding protein, partial [Anaerolineae bacterium]|nr:BMP family ABC transporter substrate-binding protein [Anaerolineae bacterium]